MAVAVTLSDLSPPWVQNPAHGASHPVVQNPDPVVVAVDIEPGVLSSATVAEMAADHGARAVAAALSGPPASADIAPAFDESILVSVLVAVVYNLGRSRFFPSPSSGSLARSSSFFEVHGGEYNGGSRDDHASYGN